MIVNNMYHFVTVWVWIGLIHVYMIIVVRLFIILCFCGADIYHAKPASGG